MRGDELVGIEQLRVYFLSLGSSQPSAYEVLTKGEVVLEARRPDLPDPGESFRLDMQDVHRPAGWIVVVPIRVGDVMGAPSDVLPWLDPRI